MTESFRDERLDLLTDELRVGVAEQRQGLLVGRDDQAPFVDYDRRVWHQRQERLEELDRRWAQRYVRRATGFVRREIDIWGHWRT